MTFLETIVAILSDQPVIDTLPNDKLNVFDIGKPIGGRRLPMNVLQRLARLQTLIVRAQSMGEMPATDVMEGLQDPGERTQLSQLDAMAAALGIQEDSTRRIMMLERLIVEIVREAVPTECERLDVRYCVNMQLEVLWSPSPRQRFLD